MSGFTLIEILVVFVLVALLLSLAMPRYLSSVDRSREKVRQQNMATLRDAIDKFRADQGRYPKEIGELVTQRYLRAIPIDPVSETAAWRHIAPPAGLGEEGIFDVDVPASGEVRE